jgi:hypothetical protein
MTNTVWLFGVAVVLLFWVVIVGVLGGVSSRLLDVVCEGRLLAFFLFLLCGWTGVWLSGLLAESRVGDHQNAR